MNKLLRRRDIEYNPMEGPIFPNVPGPPPPQPVNVSKSQSNEAGNSLLSAMKIMQSLKGQPAQGQPAQSGGGYTGGNALRWKLNYPTSPDLSFENFQTPETTEKLPPGLPLSRVTGVPNLPGVIDYSERFGGPGDPVIYDSSRAGTIGGVKSYKYVSPELFAGRSQNEIREIYRNLYSEPARREYETPIGQGEAAGLKGGTGAEGYLTNEFPPVTSVPGYSHFTGYDPIPGVKRVPTKGGFIFEITDEEKFQDWLDDGIMTPERIAVRDALEEVKETPLASIPVRGRQLGGSMKKMNPYLVGEEGPEVVVPEEDGTVIPNNALLNPNLSFKNFQTPTIEPTVAPISPVTTQNNALLGPLPESGTPSVTAEPTPKPTNALLDYWSKPVIGNMPLDKFVQIAGALSSAIAPREPMGRVGNVLSQIGGAAYKERVGEPLNELRKQYLEAHIKKLGEPEKPTEWGAFYKEHMNMINPATGKTYTVGETLKKFHEAQAIPKEPTYHYVVDDEGKVSAFSGKQLIMGTGKGATKTPTEGGHYEVNDKGEVSYYQKGELKSVSGPGVGKTKETKVTPHWNIIKDAKSETGFSYQDMNNPTSPLRTGAPVPSTEKEKEKTFKDKQIEAMWPKLSEDEKKKVVGAGIDPHELTEKNILDMYGNIFTDPNVRKSIQPIAEEIIKRATQKPIGKISAPGGKVINELPKGAKFHGYAEDGKKIYVVPPATAGGKPTYIKEQ